LDIQADTLENDSQDLPDISKQVDDFNSNLKTRLQKLPNEDQASVRSEIQKFMTGKNLKDFDTN